MPSTPRPPTRGLPLQSVPLADWIDPADAFDVLYASSPYAVWLDAGANATAGVSYLAAAYPRSLFVTASARAGTVTHSFPLDPADTPVTSPGTIFDHLRAELAGTGAAGAPEAGFRLGWVGWLGYALALDGARPGGLDASGAEPDGAEPGDAEPGDAAPDAALLFVNRVIVFDHSARTVTLVAQALPGESGEDVQAWLRGTARVLDTVHDRVHARVHAGGDRATDSPAPGTEPAAPVEVRWRHSAESYARLIDECQARIRAGDAYQLCLTTEVTIPGRFDPVEIYGRLRAGSPTHHGGLLRFGPHALLSASPEEFLSVSPGGRLRTRPIKGTRPRSSDPVADRMLRAELLASDKERAENLMIVDLMRNDLGRVAALGSVAVTGLLKVESYPHVHQLVSTVEARLAPGLTAVDAIEACFPAGSMTGAPKGSAMSILAALEGGDRGVYAGAFGYLGVDGAVDLAMVIRSIVLGPAHASIGTGGGITALSVAEEEIEETRIKARALIQAVVAASPTASPDLVT